MDKSVVREIDDIIKELSLIIKELDSISDGVRGDFKNIGNERCAAAISRVAEKYRAVKRTLQRIEGDASKNFGGGGGSR